MVDAEYSTMRFLDSFDTRRFTHAEDECGLSPRHLVLERTLEKQ